MTSIDWLTAVPDDDLDNLYISVEHHGNPGLLTRIISELWRRFAVPIKEWPLWDTDYVRSQQYKVYRMCVYASNPHDPDHRPMRILDHGHGGLRGLECSCGLRGDESDRRTRRLYRVGPIRWPMRKTEHAIDYFLCRHAPSADDPFHAPSSVHEDDHERIWFRCICGAETNTSYGEKYMPKIMAAY